MRCVDEPELITVMGDAVARIGCGEKLKRTYEVEGVMWYRAPPPPNVE